MLVTHTQFNKQFLDIHTVFVVSFFCLLIYKFILFHISLLGIFCLHHLYYLHFNNTPQTITSPKQKLQFEETNINREGKWILVLWQEWK